MNIEGVERQLPLFEPPIDPGLLVKAVAAGVDIGSVLSDMNAPLPPYRFNVMSQKATELCAEVKSLGAALLSALEKRDAEALSLLRSGHEIDVLELMRQIKELQVEEANAAIRDLEKSLEMSQMRFRYYCGLLTAEIVSLPDESEEPQEVRLATAFNELAQDLSPTYALAHQAASSAKEALEPFRAKVEPYVRQARERLQQALSLPALQQDSEQKISLLLAMNELEKSQLDELKISNENQLKAMDYEALAGTLALIPDLKIGAPPTIGGTLGGTSLATAARVRANAFNYEASEHSYRANLHQILAGYQRRTREWIHQANLSLREIEQTREKSAAAGIRLAIAWSELRNHYRQIENAKTVDANMRDKFTNGELYDWMVGQISGIYFQSYQLAYDVAKRAERAYRHELGLGDSNFIQFGYWDSLKKGLLAGERLYQDLKRMEVSYLDQNRREYEIIKHVSLAQLDPVALVQFKQTGECFINVPEALFDLDYPGHYMRRIKSVGITIPCVTGPYTSVNCTLTLLKSSVRQSNALAGGKYSRQDNDTRFTDNIGAIQSVVTSSGQNDSGLFEPNLRDERYLPFEGAGVDSEWRIELPMEFRQFDYDTISDVVLHVRYTAREGGGLLKQRAITELQTAINEITAAEGEKGLARLFSLGHEFPSEYRRFLQGVAGEQKLTLRLAKDRFPYLLHGKTIQANKVELLVKLSDKLVAADGGDTTFKLTCPDTTTTIGFDLSAAAKLGDLLRIATNLPQGQKVHSDPEESTWTLEVMSVGPDFEEAGRLNPDAIEDIGLIVYYTVA